jgi:antitoxin FitA
MAKSITLKNLPDALHARLAAAAKRHRRSLNNEAIVCLQAALGTDPLAVEQQLAEIRALRTSLRQHNFDPAEIDAFKREARP